MSNSPNLDSGLTLRIGSDDSKRGSVPSRGTLHNNRGFLLLETMLGVFVFAIGVLALARCVNNCLGAEAIKAQDQRARLALENRMAEIEAGAVLVEEAKSEKLKGAFSGIVLKQSRIPSPLKTEKGDPLLGVFVVTLEAVWQAPEGSQSKDLTFYVFRPNQQ